MATQPLVLLVGHEQDLCHQMQKTLARISVRTHIAHHQEQAKLFLSEYSYQACIIDLDFAEASGLELIQYIFTQFPQTPVCALSSNANLDSITTALHHGAFECLSKPVQTHQLHHLVHKAIYQSSHALLHHKTTSTRLLIGECSAIQQLRLSIQKIARSQSSVFIGGESGTGKEVVAHLIHKLSDRRTGPLITLNCGAITEDQMESELFGHRKESFVGATQDKAGLIQAANGGSLFLDEVAELPLTTQVKLLRAVQEKKVRPLGSATEISVDFRLLSASHQNLELRVLNGRFRQDLFYRIHVVDIILPPLRERGQDILILAYHFIEQISHEWNIRSKQLSKAAQDFLLQYDFAGNVRELRNMIERALILSDDHSIDQRHLLPRSSTLCSLLGVHEVSNNPSPDDQTGAQNFKETEANNIKVQTFDKAKTNSAAKIPEEGLEQFLENIERDILLHALTLTRWNRTLAAKKLGMSFRSLRYRLKKLGLDGTEHEFNELKAD